MDTNQAVHLLQAQIGQHAADAVNVTLSGDYDLILTGDQQRMIREAVVRDMIESSTLRELLASTIENHQTLLRNGRPHGEAIMSALQQEIDSAKDARTKVMLGNLINNIKHAFSELKLLKRNS